MSVKFKIKKIWDTLKKPPRKEPLYSLFIRKPESAKTWTTLYYGERGSGKTLHQSKEMMNILRYLRKLYTKRPDLHRAIVFTNQKVSKEVQEEFKDYLYFWNDVDDFRYCPRKNCWRGKKKHPLHGCYLIFDDVSIILDPRNWMLVPDWLKKYFFLGRHFGIHMLASLVNPNAVDVSFRRCVDTAFQFTKILGTPDPDETQPAIKRIWGMYRRRKVDAKTLWRQGDLPEQTIRLMLLQREQMNQELKEQGKELDIVEDESWRGSYHLFNKTGKLWWWGRMFPPIASTQIYDTLQNVKEFEPRGFICSELRCIDPNHIHPWDLKNEDGSPREATLEEIKELKKRPNFCDYTRKRYEVV